MTNKWEIPSSERCSNWPEVTQHVRGRARIGIQISLTPGSACLQPTASYFSYPQTQLICFFTSNLRIWSLVLSNWRCRLAHYRSIYQTLLSHILAHWLLGQFDAKGTALYESCSRDEAMGCTVASTTGYLVQREKSPAEWNLLYCLTWWACTVLGKKTRQGQTLTTKRL